MSAMFYELEPEVAGGIGERSVLDYSSRPLRVVVLHYEFQGWLGDDLLETVACYIVTDVLRAALEAARPTGCVFDDVIISKSADFQEAAPDARLPGFHWLKVDGSPGIDDFGMSRMRRLAISDRILRVMQQHSLHNCTIRPYRQKKKRCES